MGNLVYFQKSGELHSSTSVSSEPFAVGYSGAAEHKDNPESQCVQDLGPIPRGWYSLGNIEDIAGLPKSIRLEPDSENEMCGRSGFLIHGDHVERPGWASAGCIVVELSKRIAIAESGMTRLEVREG